MTYEDVSDCNFVGFGFLVFNNRMVCLQSMLLVGERFRNEVEQENYKRYINLMGLYRLTDVFD